MTLDSSVMNVAIATVAKDVGTTVTGIQTAITLYTLSTRIPAQQPGSAQTRRPRKRRDAATAQTPDQRTQPSM
jgi:hypothetical protein